MPPPNDPVDVALGAMSAERRSAWAGLPPWMDAIYVSEVSATNVINTGVIGAAMTLIAPARSTRWHIIILTANSGAVNVDIRSEFHPVGTSFFAATGKVQSQATIFGQGLLVPGKWYASSSVPQPFWVIEQYLL